jgi:hypothetical protein
MSNKKINVTFDNINDSNISIGNISINKDVVKLSAAGFRQEQDKLDFVKTIEEVRSLLLEIKSNIEIDHNINQDKKDDVLLSCFQEINNLKLIKENVKNLPVGIKPSREESDKINDHLKSNESFLSKTTRLTNKLLPHIKKGLLLLIKARQLFGFP